MSEESKERRVPVAPPQEEVYDEPLSEETSYGVPCDMTVEEARNPELVRPYKLWEDKLDDKLIPDAAFIVFIKRDFDKEKYESNEVWQGVEYSKQIQLYTIPYVWWGYFFNKKEYHNRYGYDTYSVKALNPRLGATKMYQKIYTLNMFSHDAINEVYQKTGRGKNVYHIYVSFQDGKIWLSSDSPMKREFNYKDWGDALYRSFAGQFKVGIPNISFFTSKFLPKNDIDYLLCNAASKLTGQDMTKGGNRKEAEKINKTFTNFCFNEVTRGIKGAINSSFYMNKKDLSSEDINTFLKHPIDISMFTMNDTPYPTYIMYSRLLESAPTPNMYAFNKCARNIYKYLKEHFAYPDSWKEVPAEDGKTFSELFFEKAEELSGLDLKRRALSIRFTEDFLSSAIFSLICSVTDYSYESSVIGNFDMSTQMKISAVVPINQELFAKNDQRIKTENCFRDRDGNYKVLRYKEGCNAGSRYPYKDGVCISNQVDERDFITHSAHFYLDHELARKYSYIENSDIIDRCRAFSVVLFDYNVIPYYDRDRIILFSLSNPSKYYIAWEANQKCF